MRVVIDTNVLVSVALKDTSLPATAVRLVERKGCMLKSIVTERQLLDVIGLVLQT